MSGPVERHVADVCGTCKGPREIHVKFQARKYSVNLPQTCRARADCEKALVDAAKVGECTP